MTHPKVIQWRSQFWLDTSKRELKTYRKLMLILTLTWLACLPAVPLIPLVTLAPVAPGLPLVDTAGVLMTVLLPPALVLTTGH